MTESAERFRTFAARLLEYKGALVECIDPEGLKAMLPERLQRELQVPEFLRLGFGAEVPRGAVRASLESDWIERLGNLLGQGGKRLRFVAQADWPPHFGETQ